MNNKIDNKMNNNKYRWTEEDKLLDGKKLAQEHLEIIKSVIGKIKLICTKKTKRRKRDTKKTNN